MCKFSLRALSVLMMLPLVTAAPSIAFAQTAQPPQPAVKQFGPRVRPAQPQPGGQSQPARRKPAKIVGKHEKWVLTCEDPRKTKDGKTVRPCGMIQTAKASNRKNVGLTLVLVNAKAPPAKKGDPPRNATMMRVMAPIGVYLPTGVALEIDGKAVGRVPFTRCLPRICIAFAEASPPTLKKLKAGGKANFIIYEAPGLGVSFEFSLKGFTAGLDQLRKL